MKPQIRQQRISQVSSFLIENNGPVEGRVHPKLSKVKLEILEEALKIAKRKGLPKEFRPYHGIGTIGVWENEEYCREIVRKKGEELLKRHRGDLGELIQNIVSEDILEDHIDIIDEREFPVKMDRGLKLIGIKGPFTFLQEYFDLKGLDDYKTQIKPYHLYNASADTYKDQAVVDELINKKFEKLKQKYGSLEKVISNMTTEDIEEDIQEEVLGHQFTISYQQLATQKSFGIYEITKRYLEINGYEQEAKQLKRYHLNRNKISPEDRDRVIQLKFESLLKTKYASLEELIANTDFTELKSRFSDKIGRLNLSINPISYLTSAPLNSSTYKIICKYLETTNQQIKGLRPYHLKKPTHKTYQTGKFDSEIRRKVYLSLVSKYGSAQNAMLQTTQADLLGRFEDKLGNHRLTIRYDEIYRNRDNMSIYDFFRNYSKDNKQPFKIQREEFYKMRRKKK
ncbi:MAG: hypothetical protein ACOCXG_01940 [Nanoarchaeota archaeon]